MTEDIINLYEAGKKDKKFLDDIYSADGDTPPSSSSSGLLKKGFAAMYYGYLVAKMGNNWRDALPPKFEGKCIKW